MVLSNTYAPQQGATANTEFGFGQGSDSSDVFAMDVTGLDGSAGGLLFEGGGTFVGCYIGFRTNGDFVARCGDGGFEDYEYTHVTVPADQAPSGDGTLIVEFSENEGSNAPNRVRVWWNGAPLGTESVGTTTGVPTAGSGVWAYAAYSPGPPSGEVATAVAFTTISDLRFYQDQQVAVASPVASNSLADMTVTEFTGVQTYDPTSDFTNAVDGTWSLPTAPPGVTINTSLGLISIDTGATGTLSGASIVVRYENSGGQADSAFSLTVQAQTPADVSVWGFDAQPKSRHTELATNVAWFNAGGRNDVIPFINRMKGARPFVPLNGSGSYSFDANGYPDSADPSWRFVSEILRHSPQLDGISPYTGNFRVYGRGEGEIALGPAGSSVIDVSTFPTEDIDGTTYWYVDFVYNSDSNQIQKFTIENLGSTPIYELALVHHDHLDNFRNGETFTPEFLADMQDYPALRFMDWVFANGLDLDENDDSPTPLKRYVPTSYFTYNTNAGGSSFNFPCSCPIEHMVALCNAISADIWLNLPADIPDSQVTAWADYVRDNLNGGLEAYWEYGNEVWNGASGFKSYFYAAHKGEEVFGISNPNNAALEYTAYRGPQTMQLVKDSWSGSGRDPKIVVPGWAFASPMDPTYGGVLYESYNYRIMKGEEAQKLPSPPPTYEEIGTEYAIGMYMGAVKREDNSDTTYGQWILDHYATPETQAEAHARWMLFGVDDSRFHDITTDNLSAPKSITWQEGLNIAVGKLVRADKVAGVDPVFNLDTLIRIDGQSLQYKGQEATSWTTVATFDVTPTKTLAQMIHDVEIIGESYVLFATTHNGISSMIMNNGRERLDEHVAWVEHLGMSFVAYEGGPHIYSPSSSEQAAMMAAFQSTGWSSVVLNAWLDYCATASVDRFFLYMSHNRLANTLEDWWGMLDYVGEPRVDSPQATLVYDTIALGTTPHASSYDPVAALGAPVMDPGLQWTAGDNWTIVSETEVVETEAQNDAISGKLLNPLTNLNSQVFSFDVAATDPQVGRLRVVIDHPGDPSVELTNVELQIADGDNVTVPLAPLDPDYRDIEIVMRRIYNKNGDLTLSNISLAPSTTQTADTATVNALPRDRAMFDGTLGPKGIPLSGTTTADNGSVIEARAVSVDDGGATTTPWRQIATASDGSWSGKLDTPISGSWYRAEVRVASSTAAPAQTAERFGVGHGIAIWGQSEIQHLMLLAKAETGAAPTISDEENLQIYWIDEDGSNDWGTPGSLRGGRITNAEPRSKHAAALSNALNAAYPGRKFYLVLHAEGGTSRVQSGADGGSRPWSGEIALRDFAAPIAAMRPDVIYESWFFNDAIDKGSGRELVDDRIIPFAIGQKVDGNTNTEFDHHIPDAYPSSGRVHGIALHRYDGSNGIEDKLGGARRRLREVFDSGQLPSFVKEATPPLTYANAASDSAHPVTGSGYLDGIVRFFELHIA
ncbi:MAG: hypothetical protein GVY24_08105, partial [Planctomycetes bacterium]|nr:hypothetical protein [Planctomycetota bacterium]